MVDVRALNAKFSYSPEQLADLARALRVPLVSRGLRAALEGCATLFVRDRAFESDDAAGLNPAYDPERPRDERRRDLDAIRSAVGRLKVALAGAAWSTRERVLGDAGIRHEELDRQLRGIDRAASALREEKKRPGPPPRQARRQFEYNVADVLDRHGVNVSGYAEGEYAQALRVALEAVGETMPSDPRAILRRVVAARNRARQRRA